MFERQRLDVAENQQVVQREPGGMLGVQQPRVLVEPERLDVGGARIHQAYRAGRSEPRQHLTGEDGRGAARHRRFSAARGQGQRGVLRGRLCSSR